MITDSVRKKKAREYDRIGCGPRFQQYYELMEETNDPNSHILAYFTVNGKEVCEFHVDICILLCGINTILPYIILFRLDQYGHDCPVEAFIQLSLCSHQERRFES